MGCPDIATTQYSKIDPQNLPSLLSSLALHACYDLPVIFGQMPFSESYDLLASYSALLTSSPQQFMVPQLFSLLLPQQLSQAMSDLK